MISSIKITDLGLHTLANFQNDNNNNNNNQEENNNQHDDVIPSTTIPSKPLPLPHLREVDITFCRNTTYRGTFPLRDRYPGIIIRRQPEWMTGHFITPFEDDGVHTYWADGSFSFERAQQSCGYVCDLKSWNEHGNNNNNNNSPDGHHHHHVGDKLQYVNFQPPAGWPDWSRFCYRPGVSLLRLEDEEIEIEEEEEQTVTGQNNPNNNANDNNNHETTTTKKKTRTVRSVLVGQRLYGIRPPHDYPRIQHKDIVPLGKSRYFDRHGTLLPHDDNDNNNNNTNNYNEAAGVRYNMVSRMAVRPLENPMPPPDIVAKNRGFCRQLQQSEQEWFLEGGEAFLHHALDRQE